MAYAQGEAIPGIDLPREHPSNSFPAREPPKRLQLAKTGSNRPRAGRPDETRIVNGSYISPRTRKGSGEPAPGRCGDPGDGRVRISRNPRWDAMTPTGPSRVQHHLQALGECEVANEGARLEQLERRSGNRSREAIVDLSDSVLSAVASDISERRSAGTRLADREHFRLAKFNRAVREFCRGEVLVKWARMVA